MTYGNSVHIDQQGLSVLHKYIAGVEVSMNQSVNFRQAVDKLHAFFFESLVLCTDSAADISVYPFIHIRESVILSHLNAVDDGRNFRHDAGVVIYLPGGSGDAS